MTGSPFALHRMAFAATALALAGLPACTNTPPTAGDASAELAVPEMPGKVIAVSLCSGCHAVDRADESPHLEALPFREISLRYPVRNLEEALGEGIFVGHPDMPPFQLAPDDIDALLDYIEAIQNPA